MTAKKQINMTLQDGVALLIFDSPDKKLNTLNQKTLEEISSYIEIINHDESIKSVVIISGKEDNFIAGADIHEFEDITAKEARMLLQNAHKLLNQIAESPKPYVAAIHGACLGGGLEVALACDYRIATKDDKTIFGSPEVLLGLIPAAGGTQRLPRVIGMKEALKLLLSGKRIRSKEAYNLGLVDYLVRTREELKSSAIKFSEDVAQKKKAKKARKLYPWSIFSLILAKRYISKKTHGHYPAPMALIDAVETGLTKGIQEGLKKERQEFGKLVEGQVSKNLIRLFFEQKSHQKIITEEEKNQENIIGIIGSGLMGSGIATVSILHSQRVYINDNNKSALEKSQIHIWNKIKKRPQSRRLLSYLTITENLQEFSHCNIIIEAVAEDLIVKQKILENCESVMNKNCIFASNTSSIPIIEIAHNSSIKDRILGMHYFSPVEKMPLLEIVKTKETSEETLKKAIQIGTLQAKTIIIVNDSPGFYTTRIISALFDEACALLLEGYSIAEIDNELVRLGFPMGPLALMDQVGLDVGYHVAEILKERLGERLVSVDLGIYESLIDAELLGHKGGRGFYIYKDHKKIPNYQINKIIEKYKNKNISKSSVSLADRMLLRMVNESVYCLSEKVIETPEDGDVGAVFGVGFPAYLGGPFQYIKQEGKVKIAKKLDQLCELYGERFAKGL